ncbi:MAG: cytidine deaminase [Gemmatimonadaceae bacterium]
MSDQSLRAAAEDAMTNAYAPYSNFRVGAAVKSGDGRVFVGCNVENASYNLGICAERSAIASAVTAGSRTFESLALVSDSDSPASPCGACRQVLAEFAPGLRITSYGLNGDVAEWTVAELLPHQFRLNNGNETNE